MYLYRVDILVTVVTVWKYSVFLFCVFGHWVGQSLIPFSAIAWLGDSSWEVTCYTMAGILAAVPGEVTVGE